MKATQQPVSHFPGPWRVCVDERIKPNNQRYAAKETGMVIAECPDCFATHRSPVIRARESLWPVPSVEETNAIVMANARLLAAAPNMLAVLRAIVDECDCLLPERAEYIRALANEAIALAAQS